MKEQTVDFNDIFNKNVIIGMQQMLQLLNDMETATKNLAKTKIKTDGGAAAVKENEKAIQENLKAQKLLMDIEKKRNDLLKLRNKEQEKYVNDTIKNAQKEEKALTDSAKKIQKENEKNLKLSKQQEQQAQKEAEKQEYLSREYVKLSKAHTQASNSLKDLISRGKTATQTQKEYDNELKNAQTQFDLLHKKILKVDNAAGQFNRNVGNYPKVSEFFGGLLAAGGIGVGLSGAFSELKDIGEMIKNFDARIAELGAISGSSKEELEPLKQTILDLGASTKFTATQVAEASIELAKLGFSNTEIQQSLKGVLDGAVAMGVGIPQMAELASKSIRAFGLTTKDTEAVVSTFAASANTTATSFQYLNDSLPYAATAARTYGMSIEQTTALLGILADNGVKAESSGVALRDIFTDLSTKGLTFEQAMAQINSSTNKAKTAFDLFGKTSVNQSIIIANNIDKFEGLTKAVTGQDKALKELVDKRLNTLEGSLQMLSSAWEGFILKLDDGTGKTSKAARSIIDFTSSILNSLTAGNALTESLGSLFKTFGELINEVYKFYTQLIPVTKGVNELNAVFEILALVIDLMPFNIIITALKYMYQGFNYLIDSIKPLNDLLKFTGEILGQVVTAVKATNEEMKSLVITNQKFGQVSKAVYDLLSITIAGLTEAKTKQFEFGEATKEATKLTKEQEEALKNLEKQLIATSEQFGKALAGELVDKERAKDLLEPINNELLNIAKVGKKVGIELKNGLIAGFNEAGKVEEFNFEELYSALNDLKSNGLELFSEINSANQERTENAISESEKRIEALQSEYETEKSLQEQRKAEGKRYDESRLTELNKSIAAESEAKARQEEQLKKFQKRQLITQIIADEASALSSAIVAAFANRANAFTFGAAGIAQLAAMTVQLTAAFFKVRGALEKFEDGGLVGGKPHSQGGTIIEAQKGEFVINAESTSQSPQLVDLVNQGKITDKHLQLLINPIPNNTQTNIFDTKNVESLLSEQISVNRSGFGELKNTSYIEHGFKVVRKNGLTTRYK